MRAERASKIESLADYVRRVANEKDLTFREVARRGGISAPSVSDIVSGKTQEIKNKTVAALAKGLGVSEQEVYAVASGTPEPASTDVMDEIKVMFYGFSDLSKEDQAKTLEAVRMIAESMQRRRATAGRNKKQ